MLIPAQLRDVTTKDDGYSGRFRDLFFIVSEAVELDGEVWRHASVSRRDRKMPTHDDLCTLKRLTIGDHRVAIQVFPEAENHVDIAGRGPRPLQVLHLWSPENNPLPDFTQGTGSI